MSSTKQWNLILIDASYMTYKLYYGHLNSGEDRDIGELLSSIALGLQNGTPDTIVVVCYDGKPKHRLALHPEYKAGRTKDENTAKIKEHIKRSVYWMNQKGIRTQLFDDYEADDVIASYCVKGAMNGMTIQIISSDKDMYPLLQYKNVEIFKGYRAYGRELDADLIEPEDQVTSEDVKRRFGITPAQWMDFRCFTGDSSDNIGGLKGWGDAKASWFLKLYGSIEEAQKKWDIVEAGLTDKARKLLNQYFADEYKRTRRIFILEDCLPVSLKRNSRNQP